MRVAVMAAGAVGGYFGGRMAAAGNDVAFIARGAHGDAIRRDGLKIESALGDLHLRNVNVTDDPKQVGPVDVVLFAVKLWDTETAGKQTRALVGPNTRVIAQARDDGAAHDWLRRRQAKDCREDHHNQSELHRNGVSPNRAVTCAASCRRFAASNLAKVGVIAGSHPSDIAPEIVVALSFRAQRRIEARTQRTGNEGENGRIDAGRLAAYEERFAAEKFRSCGDRSRAERDDLGG